MTVDLFDLWTVGIPLSEAPGHFTKIRKRPNRPLPAPDFQLLAKAHPEMTEQLAQFGSALSEFQNDLSTSSDYATRQRSALMEGLLGRSLIALGFRPNARSGEPPEMIPLHLFNPRNIKWNSGKIKSKHLEYVAVRIVESPAKTNQGGYSIDNSATPEEVAPSTALTTFDETESAAERRKFGRPPVDQELRQCVDELLNELHAEPIRKRQEALVRDRAQNLFPQIFPPGSSRPSRGKVLAALAAVGIGRGPRLSKKYIKSN